jgi:SAM-dependent methyltransferase
MEVDMEAGIKNEELIKLIKKTPVNTSFIYNQEALLDEKISYMAANCSSVLDVGKSSRQRFAMFEEDQITTMDINQYENYPDIVDDLCDIQNLKWGAYDGIICMSVLEHVYAPQLAVDNLHKLLRDGGFCLIHVPFLFKYHASPDLKMQDYYRFTRDGVAFLFRNFSEVTIYPMRGRHSSIFNLFGFWKPKIEKRFGQGLNKFIDKTASLLTRQDERITQASGYFLWVKR